MSQDTQINVGMNVDGVATGVNKAKGELRSLQAEVDKVSKLSKEGGAALVKVGEGVDAEKAVKQLSRLAQQVKRVSDEAVLGRNSVELFSQKLEKTGVSKEVYQPLLDQFSKVNSAVAQNSAAYTQAGKALNEYGMGAKATSAALRQVPAQFTDIIVSLQGGQAPLTVLLQQGGQLKDVFGGVGNAAKALGGYIMGLINPFTVAAAAVGGVAFAYKQATNEVDAYRAALVLSGNATGVSIGRLQGMAASIGTTTGTVGAAASALALMAGEGKVAAGGLERATEAALRFEKFGGVAIKETAKAMSELANDPVAASEKLNKQYNYLTAAIYEQIKALAEQGDKAGAVALAQDAYTTAQSRMATELESGLGRVEQAWALAGKAAKGAWDEFLGVFRPDSIEKVIADLESRMQFGNGLYGVGGQDKAAIQEQLTYWKNRKASDDDYAASQKRNAQQTEAQIVLDKAHASSLDKVARAQKEIAALSGTFATVDQTPENIAKYAASVQSILDKSKDKTKVKATDADKGLTLYNDQLAKSVGLTANFAEQQALLAAKFGKDNNMAEYSAGLALLIAQQPYMVDSLKAEATALEVIAKARTSSVQAHASELANINEKAQKIEDEVAMYGMSKEAIEALTTARMLDQIEVLRGFDNSAEEIARIEQTIAARKRLAAAGASLDVKDANAKAAKDMAAEQKKAAEASSKYWEDALMRAFESGKGFFESLWDTIKNTLKTQILKVSIQGVMGGIGIGAAGAAAAGQDGGNLLGVAGNLSSLYNTLSGGLNVAMQSGSQLAGLAAQAGSQVVAGFAGGMVSTASMASATAAAQAGGSALAGVIAGSVLNGMAGYGISKAISGGYELGSVNTIAGIASMIPGVGPLAGVVGGLVNRAFGSGPLEMTGQGTRGTFGANGFTGQNYANYTRSGGWFSSDTNTTDYSALDTATARAWSDAFAGVKTSMSGMATSLGLATTNITAYTKAVDIAAGTTAEQMTAIFTGMADDMAKASAPGIAEFAKVGETASTTLGRLSGALTGTNAWLSMLKNRLFDVSLAGANAASQLADAFGGLDNLAASSKAYYEAYYTEAERTATASENIAKSLALVNVAMPSTKDAFRSVVTSLDLTTDAGRNAYAVMLALAPEFATVADAAAASAAKIAAANQSWQDKLDVLMGTQTERTLALRDAADDTTRALMQQVYAQEDLKTAADAALQAAKDLAATLIATYVTAPTTAVPTMESVRAKLVGITSASSTLATNLTYINAEMGNAASAVLTLSNAAATVDDTTTAAQAATQLLNDQIDTLAARSKTATVDMGGLTTALANVDTATFVATLTGVFENLATQVQEVFASITTERVAVREAALSIIGPQIYTKAQIQAGIAAAQVGMPSNAGVVAAYANQTAVGNAATNANAAAAQRTALAQQQVAAAEAARTAAIGTAQAALNASVTTRNNVAASDAARVAQYQNTMAADVANFKNLAAQAQGTAAAYQVAFSANGNNANDAFTYNAGTNRVAGFANIWDRTTTGRSGYHFLQDARAAEAAAASQISQLWNANNVLAGDERNIAVAKSQQANNSGYYNSLVANAQSNLSGTTATQNYLVAQQQAALNTKAAQQAQTASAGEAAKAAADAKSKAALLAYTTAMQQYTLDAGKATTQLGRLKDETVKYYTEQKRLSELMTASAVSLRTTVADYRYSQLSETDQLAQLKTQFGTAYSMALSTSGESLAGYADQLNSKIGPLIDKLNATGQTQYINSYLAQLETVAAKLEATAPVNYQADSLALLDTIDASLKALEDGTSSATKILKDAIDAGTTISAAGLRQVVQRLGGVPAFASGGTHSGGLRMVGENGPELEVTGPSHIFNARQTSAMLGGGSSGNTARLEALVARQTQQLEDMRYELRSIAINTGRTSKTLSAVTQDGQSISTTVAA